MHTKITAIIAGIAFVCSANADSLDTVLVSVSRIPVTESMSGSSVTVIQEKELEQAGTVISALERVPGVEVVQTGGVGTVATVFIRGAESDQTLVLIDGVRANDNTSGLFDLSNLEPTNIERIEVVRGAQSVIYGSEAMGGVINVITKKSGDASSVTLEGGSFGSYRGTASLASDIGSLAASFRKTDGFSAADDSESDGYENFSISGGTDLDISDNANVQISARYYDGDVEVDGFDFLVGPVDDLNFEQETELLGLSTRFSNQFSDAFSSSVALGFIQNELTGSDPDTEFNNFSIDSESFTVSNVNQLEVGRFGMTAFGYEFQSLDGKNESNFDDSREVHGFFAEHLIEVYSGTTFSSGLRHEVNTDYSDETSFRGSLVSKIDSVKVFANFSTGFRAPSFNELAFPGFGNENLETEKNISFDLGVDAEIVGATFFWQDFEDLISSDPVTFQAVNIQEARSFGFETFLAIPICVGAKGDITYTFLDTKDKDSGRILPRRPRHKARFSLDLTFTEGLKLSPEVILVNSRRDSDQKRLDNYVLVNLYGNYNLLETYDIFLRVINLFDEDYQEVGGFSSSGFAAYGGVKLTF